MNNFKKGDFYRWSFKEEYTKGKSYEGLYWCKSQIAYFNGDYLYDTYWSSNNSNYEIDLNKVDLVFMGNIFDYEKISEYEKQYYDPNDILDISHLNNRLGDNLFVRRGASRSKDMMLYKLKEQIDKEQSEINYHKRNLTHLLDKQAQLQDNDEIDLNSFYF